MGTDGIVRLLLQLDSDTLFLYLPEIKEQAKSLTSVQAEHCALLVDYLEMDYQSKKDRLFPMLASGIITFDLVWALFKPGTIAVMRMDLFDDLQCFEVDYVTLHESEKKQHKAHYRIEGHTLAHDGKKFGYYDMQVELPRFKGTRQITKLAVYPLDYCGEPIETRTRLLNRGAKFVILQGVHTQSYDGQAVLPDKSRSVYIDGRIVIDKVGYKRSHAPVADASFNALGTGHDTFTEEQLLIASPLVSGFSLHRNRWFHFLVSKVKDVEWSDPFPSVVLPDSIKQSVEGLISAHNQHSSKVVKDIVEGKGDGVVLVLHGPSGCGKTLTAEAVAERLRVPLYSISAGELGEKPADLAENIRDIFELAHSWQAVLLVDEADALLEERRRGDTKRNAMVSTLLRSLEQYRGVMIMTTNYVDRFDTALSSRVHLFVEYKRLGRPDRKRLWAFCISRATDYKINFEDDDLEDLSKEELNAREVSLLPPAHCLLNLA